MDGKNKNEEQARTKDMNNEIATMRIKSIREIKLGVADLHKESNHIRVGT